MVIKNDDRKHTHARSTNNCTKKMCSHARTAICLLLFGVNYVGRTMAKRWVMASIYKRFFLLLHRWGARIIKKCVSVSFFRFAVFNVRTNNIFHKLSHRHMYVREILRELRCHCVFVAYSLLNFIFIVAMQCTFWLLFTSNARGRFGKMYTQKDLNQSSLVAKIP